MIHNSGRLLVPMEDQQSNTVSFHSPSVELLRFSKDGIWVNPDIPVDEVARQVFAILEPLIVQAYNNAAVAAAEKELRS